MNVVILERRALYVGNVGGMLSMCERDTPIRPHWRHRKVADCDASCMSIPARRYSVRSARVAIRTNMLRKSRLIATK